MSQNLLESFKRTLGEDVAGQLAKRLGEPEDQIRSAMDGVLPVLLGGLAQRGATAQGAASLMKTVATVPADPLMLAAPVKLLTEDTGALERMTTMGPGLLGFLFGNKAGGLAGALASVSGLRSSSTSWIAAFLTPIVCALLNREVQARKLDANGLHHLLAAQRPTLQGALDRRILNALGISNLSAYLSDIGTSAPAAPSVATPSVAPPSVEARAPASVHALTEPQPRFNVLRFAPWIVLIVILLLLWPLLKS
jgi:hypothetical protein